MGQNLTATSNSESMKSSSDSENSALDSLRDKIFSFGEDSGVEIQKKPETILQSTEKTLGKLGARVELGNLSKWVGKISEKIVGQNLENQINIVRSIDDKKLDRMLDGFLVVKKIQNRISGSFFAKIAGFFGAENFSLDEIVEELIDQKTKKLKTRKKYISDKIEFADGFFSKIFAGISGSIIFSIVKSNKSLLDAVKIYHPARKIIDIVGKAIEKVKGLGSDAVNLLQKFSEATENSTTATFFAKKLGKNMLKFAKNPKKMTGEILKTIKSGNKIPGFAEIVKKMKLPGVKFYGSGSAAIVILSKTSLQNMLHEKDIPDETTAEKWIPGLKLFTRGKLSALITAVRERGFANSKIELLDVGLEIADAGLTIWSVAQIISLAVAVVGGGGFALATGVVAGLWLLVRRGSTTLLRKNLAKIIQKLGVKFAKKESRKAILKKTKSFAIQTGGLTVASAVISAVVPKINEKLISAASEAGSVVARKIFTPTQIRAYELYRKFS